MYIKFRYDNLQYKTYLQFTVDYTSHHFCFQCPESDVQSGFSSMVTQLKSRFVEALKMFIHFSCLNILSPTQKTSSQL